MLKTSAIFFIFLVLYFNVTAQNNLFEEGYIIQNSDTIKGFIRIASDLELSKTVSFRTEPNAETTTNYTPESINGFYFNNSGFYYAAVPVEIRKGRSAERTIRFAKQLLSGYTSLFKLPIPAEEQSIVLSRQNTHLYVLKKDAAFYTLGLYETLEGNAVKTDKRYVGILRAVFDDCDANNGNLNQLGFDDKSIMKAVVRYNACKNPATQTAIHTYKSGAVVKHGPEVTLAQSFIPSNNNDYDAQAYSVGYFWDIIKPDLSRNYSGKFGLAYMRYKYSYQNHREAQVSGVAHYVRMPLAVQYNFKDAISSSTYPFLNAGLTTLVPTKFSMSGIAPLQTIGAGLYHKRLRFAFLLENEGLSIDGFKLLNFAVAVRLDSK